jgi:hypothetical protein
MSKNLISKAKQTVFYQKLGNSEVKRTCSILKLGNIIAKRIGLHQN